MSINIHVMNDLDMIGDFSSYTFADWQKLVEKTTRLPNLDGLRTTLVEDCITEPLYTASDRHDEHVAISVHNNANWTTILPLIYDNQSTEAFHIQDTERTSFLVDGRAEHTVSKLSTCLEHVFKPEVRGLYLKTGASPAQAAIVIEALQGHGGDCSQAALSLGFDPITLVAITGKGSPNDNACLTSYIDAAFAVKEIHPHAIAFMASDHAWHKAGGAVIEELAYTLSAALSYWRDISRNGMDLQQSLSCIAFQLTAHADIFLTVAKFRAIRVLWRKIVTSVLSDVDNADCIVIGETSHRMLTIQDAHTNLLRGTAAAFAAITGGADGIIVQPFDSVYQSFDPLSSRLARNTGYILHHESHIGRVNDAVAGSWYVEDLTHNIAKQAWALFQDIERVGGVVEALKQGLIQDRIQAVRKKRETAIATRKQKLTGISAFPNLDQNVQHATLKSKYRDQTASRTHHSLSLPVAQKGQRFQALCNAARSNMPLQDLERADEFSDHIISLPLTVDYRDAEPFEALLDQSSMVLKQSGVRPSVFIVVTDGHDKSRSQAQWVEGLFAAAGIVGLQTSSSINNIEKCVDAFQQSPAAIICLCGVETSNADIQSYASALKQTGAKAVYYAQSSKQPAIERTKWADVDDMLYEGCDVLAVLQNAYRMLQ